MKKQILIAENDENVYHQIKGFIGPEYDVRLFSDFNKLEDDINFVGTIFIRMDDTYYNSHSLFKKIRQMYFSIKLVWMSPKEQDAATAFEEQADAFLILPPNKENISNVLKRLKFIKVVQKHT